MFNLRGDLFVLQQSGVSKLGVNPRVVVDNSDAAAVTIATGTGRDYIGRAGNDIATIQKQGVFLCERLPSQLKVEKVYYTDAASPQLVPADSYTTQTLPMQIILKLTFLDMD